MTAWTDHVKQYRAKHKCSYRDALKRASKTYKKKQSQQGSGKAGDFFKKVGKDFKKTFNKFDDFTRKNIPVDMPLQALLRVAVNPKDPLSYARLSPWSNLSEQKVREIKGLAGKKKGPSPLSYPPQHSHVPAVTLDTGEVRV